MAERRNQLRPRRTQPDIAAIAGVTLRQVKRWEAGTSTPYRSNHEGIATAYDWPLDRIDELLEIDAEDDEPPSEADTFAGVERRYLIVGGAAATAAVVLAPTQVFAAPKDVPPELASYFAAQLGAHVSADTRLGARPLLTIVTHEYQLIRDAARVAAPAQRSDLLAVGVGYADVAAWLFQDLGDLVAATQWQREALELAHRANDPDLVAVVLASMAFVAVDAGDGPGAVDLVTGALNSPGQTGTATGYVQWQAAHAHSLAGDSDATEAALDTEPYHGAGEPAAWWWAGTSPTARQRATCYGRLGRWEDAAEIWAQSLEALPPGQRNRGNALARYATALLELDGPQAALTPAAEAVACLEHAPSARMRRELRELRDRATERLDASGGRDLHEVLAGV